MDEFGTWCIRLMPGFGLKIPAACLMGMAKAGIYTLLSHKSRIAVAISDFKWPVLKKIIFTRLFFDLTNSKFSATKDSN